MVKCGKVAKWKCVDAQEIGPRREKLRNFPSQRIESKKSHVKSWSRTVRKDDFSGKPRRMKNLISLLSIQLRSEDLLIVSTFLLSLVCNILKSFIVIASFTFPSPLPTFLIVYFLVRCSSTLDRSIPNWKFPIDRILFSQKFRIGLGWEWKGNKMMHLQLKITITRKHPKVFLTSRCRKKG